MMRASSASFAWMSSSVRSISVSWPSMSEDSMGAQIRSLGGSGGREDEETAVPHHSNAWHVEGLLAMPVGDEPCDLQRLVPREAHSELAQHDVADDALSQCCRVRREGADRY